MLLNGISVGIGLLFISLLYLSPNTHRPDVNKPSKLVGGIIVLLCWLVSGSLLLDQGIFFARLYIASIPCVFFLLSPMIYNYQLALTAFGKRPNSSENQSNQTVSNKTQPIKSLTNIRVYQWLPLGLACLLSLSIGFMPSEDFNNMFFTGSNQLSVWANINAAGFAFLLIGWTVLSFLYLRKIVLNTKAHHHRLKVQFANHDGKRLDWLVGFTSLLVFTWLYALLVLGVASESAPWFISETVLSLMVMLLILMFAIQALNAKPAFADLEPIIEPEPVLEPEPAPESKEASEQKYSNSSVDNERLKRIAGKIEHKVMEEKSYLNPDIDASTLATDLGISVHYLSQAFSQEMQTTFYSYINDARIEAAKVALKTSQQTVLDIAFSVGFNTRSSFYNAFKKNTGMTPSKFKAEKG